MCTKHLGVCEDQIGQASSPLNPSHMSPNTEDFGGLDTFAVCQEITSSDKHEHDFKGQRKRERQLTRWSDQIRSDTGFLLDSEAVCDE